MDGDDNNDNYDACDDCDDCDDNGAGSCHQSLSARNMARHQRACAP